MFDSIHGKDDHDSHHYATLKNGNSTEKETKDGRSVHLSKYITDIKQNIIKYILFVCIFLSCMKKWQREQRGHVSLITPSMQLHIIVSRSLVLCSFSSPL